MTDGTVGADRARRGSPKIMESAMNKSNESNQQTTGADDFALPLPEPIVLDTAETRLVAGGLVRPILCIACGLMQPFPVEAVNL
jgi:hypothetical protein